MAEERDEEKMKGIKTLYNAALKLGVPNLREICEKAGLNHKIYSDKEIWQFWARAMEYAHRKEK